MIPFEPGSDHRDPAIWQSRRLWSLRDMIKIEIRPFLDAQDLAVQWSFLLHNESERFAGGVSVKARTEFAENLRPVLAELASEEAEMCRRGVERVIEELARTGNPPEIASVVDDLRRRLLDHASSTYCLSLSRHERNLYAPKEPLFGDLVEAKFPAVTSEDIAEAGKCISVSRCTAAVFHLMRVMETAVQKLGETLNIDLVHEKNWQNILNEVNKAIKALDHKQEGTKKLAEISSHLYAVKIAWRNEVMHPKQTYTTDEADTVFRNVRVFMRDLAAVI